ncbi:hypothetical protein VQL36_13330 [Chengkuizengella sp. SCS-71B]|uniref:hypothetical protein n=1 Tax=Chengkuizengella sp. SCS-71B TaxID=3115290 RepID=UPI0032C24BA0
MGIFDESICDCCVCPMQCVLKQLVGANVVMLSKQSAVSGVIEEVKDFIVFISSDGNGQLDQLPICNVTAVICTSIDRLSPKLKPISNSNKHKGECNCCERPITSLASSLTGETVDVEFIGEPLDLDMSITIVNVGKGILSGKVSDSPILISTCAITRIIPQ